MVAPLATGAQAIVSARLKGKRPDEMIRVSLVGTLIHGNHVVYADPGTAYDWRWACGLRLVLYVGAEPNWAVTLKAIAAHRPRLLYLWNTVEDWGARVWLVPTKEDIEAGRPPAQWENELDFSEFTEWQNQEFSKCS